MPRRRTSAVYSIYHAMDEKGVFDQNKANASAVNNDGISVYEGPVQYPKMLYHPKGELYCITQGIMVTDRDNRPLFGEDGKPKYAGAVYGVKHVIIETEAQEAEMIAKGWHFTEAQALRANPEMGSKAPPKTKTELQEERITQLEKELAAALVKHAPAAVTAAEGKK